MLVKVQINKIEQYIRFQDLKEVNFVYRGTERIPEGILVNDGHCWVTNDEYVNIS